MALCSRVGVREFDLLHVIPQGEAFEHRAELFYDVDAHADALRRVFRYARVPGFHIWTNRFPVQHLEGLEELIQDPHKMLDEVGGRRVQFRRYLDEGTPIDCRDAKRCPHCFIEPFCSTLDRHVARAHAGGFDEFAIGAEFALAAHAPAGVRWLGVSALPPAPIGPLRVHARVVPAGTLLPPGSRVVVEGFEELDAALALGVEVELRLDRTFAAALLQSPIGSMTAAWSTRPRGRRPANHWRSTPTGARSSSPSAAGCAWRTCPPVLRRAPASNAPPPPRYAALPRRWPLADRRVRG